MSPFAVYATADSQCFKLGQTTLKLPLPGEGGSRLHVIYGSFEITRVKDPTWHLDRFSSAVFCRAHECDEQTDTQTNGATPVCSNRRASGYCWLGLKSNGSI